MYTFLLYAQMNIVSMKSCHSCCSKTALKDSAAMSSAKQPDHEPDADYPKAEFTLICTTATLKQFYFIELMLRQLKVAAVTEREE